MKNNNPVQEILLMQNTRFLLRTWLEQKDVFEKKYNSSGDQLKEACWNGLLQEMLPEIYGKTCGDTKLYLWQIREAVSFIEIELGELPGETEKYFSIDPYSFLQTLSLS